MRLNEITEKTLNEILNDLTQKQNHYLSRLIKAFETDSRRVLTSLPVNIEGKTYPFPLAYKIHLLLLALQGKKPFPPTWREIVTEIIELVWTQPFITQSLPQTIDEWEDFISWPQWEEEPLGLIIRATLDANDLLDGKDMKLPGLARLSSLTYPAVVKQAKYKTNPLKGPKIDGEWVIPNDIAKYWLKTKGVQFEK